MRAIKPYSIIKLDQIKVGLSFLAHRRRDHSRTKAPRGECARCDWFESTIKELKQVNSVNLPEMREYRAKPEEVGKDQKSVRELLERVETRLSESNKTNSACEKDIVHV